MDAHDQNGDAMTDGPEFDRCFRDTLETLLAWRRDVRRFRTEPLPDGLLADLLRLAALSPSVGNAQPWRFVIVEDEGRRADIVANFERANADALRLVGASLAWEEQQLHFGGVSFAAGAHVVLSPSFAPTLAVLKSRFSSPARVSVTRRSTLVVEGAGVTVDALELDGVLVIDASEADPSVTLAVRFARPVVNKGWELVKLGADEEERARLREGQAQLDAAQLELQLEQLQMRGYRLQKMETDPKYVVTLKGRGKSSGRFVLDESGLHGSPSDVEAFPRARKDER